MTLRLGVGVMLLLTPRLEAAEWLQWGGPSGDFVIEGEELEDSWPETGPPVLWRRPLGDGYSTILYRDGRLYTLYRDGSQEVVVSLDSHTGETLWEHRYEWSLWPDHDSFRQSFSKGPNATPLIVGQRIIAASTNGQIRCLNLTTGALEWMLDLPDTFGRRKRDEEYGYSASPLRYKDSVILQVDNHGVIAVRPADGSLVWGSEPTSISYAQATLARLGGEDQYVYFSTQGVHAIDPTTGRSLWFFELPYNNFELPYNNGNHLTPIVPLDDRHVYVSSQFTSGGGRLLQLKPSSPGYEVKELWFTSKLRGSCWTLIRRGDFIYGSAGGHEVSFLSAFDWRTGEIAWRERGFHMAQALLADDKLVLLTEDGKLVLATVSPNGLEVLGSHQITESPSWTLPTLVDGTLYVRDRTHALALDLSKRSD
jgi:outer membrane protein assembly factor BamB